CGRPAGLPGRPADGRRRGGPLVPPHRLPDVTVTSVELDSRPAGVPPGSAAADVLATDVSGLRQLADAATPADVDRALRATRRSLADFAVLLSPAADARLDDLARLAHATTLRRFGPTVRLFAPLYLSNECVSTRTYCG